MLNEKKIKSLLLERKISLIGKKLKVYKSVVSTNDVVYEMAMREGESGLVVVADYQTAGKGRLGRSWFAKEGAAILLSCLISDEQLTDNALALTPTASIATLESLKTITALNLRIRWPNDVVCNSKKLSGILVEGKNISDKKRIFIIGVGINVNLTQDDFPPDLKSDATSVLIETKKEFQRETIIVELISQLDQWYHALVNGNIELINKYWREYSEVLNKKVQISEGNKIFNGRVVDMDVLEGLFVELDAGGIRNFRGEFIEWLRILL